MNRTDCTSPKAVPEEATPFGNNGAPREERVRVSKGSRLVWTIRMREALERGNQGRKWHTLIDKVYSPKALKEAVLRVTARKGAPGIDGQTPQAFRQRWEEEVEQLERLLREDKYQPKPAKRSWIEKPGSREKRPLGIPTVRDRVVQSALLYVIEPIFEAGFAEHSYGFRPGRRAQQAVERTERLLEEGRHWVVDADIQGFFDHIDQEKLLARVSEKIADSRVLGLIEKFLGQGVMDSARGWSPTEEGTPQGAVISPLLANIYLDALDHEMAEAGLEMIRYADDFVVLCRSQEEAQSVLERIERWMTEQGLTLHPEKTKIVDARERGGFDFLGWHFERGYKWPREKSRKKFKDAIRKETGRSNGRSLEEIIVRVNRRVRGWGNYFQGGVRNVPESLDGWIRMRLRSILRKRDKRKGRGRGLDHNRYPNAFFAEAGLISLITITHPQPPAPRKG